MDFDTRTVLPLLQVLLGLFLSISYLIESNVTFALLWGVFAGVGAVMFWELRNAGPAQV